MADNNISDLSAAASLSKLQVLAVRDNRIVDISPIMALKSLQNLYLQGNPLSEHSLNEYDLKLQSQGINPGDLLVPPEVIGKK